MLGLGNIAGGTHGRNIRCAIGGVVAGGKASYREGCCGSSNSSSVYLVLAVHVLAVHEHSALLLLLL